MAGRSEHAQTRFTGELSPRLHGRWDTDLYRGGLALCENWEVLAQGPLRRRAGTGKRATLTGGVRVIPLRTAQGSDFSLVIGDGTIRIVNVNGGNETLGAVTLDVELVGSGWAAVAGSPVYAAGVMELDPGEAMRIALTVTQAGNHTFSFENKSFLGDTLTRSIGVKVGSSPGASDVKAFTSYFRGDWGAQPAVTVTFPSAGTYYLQLTAGENGAAVTVYARTISMRYVSSGGAVVGPWNILQAAEVQYVAETGIDRTVLVHPAVAPQTLTRLANGTWQLDAAVFTSPPAEWAAGNYPGAVDIHQSRLLLGGTPLQPNAFWASRVGLLFDFRRFTDTTDGGSTPHAGPATAAIKITPECAIAQKVATKGRIRWLQGRQALLVGTDLGVYSITAQSGAIAPADLHIVQQSGFGSAAIQAVDIGDAVLYVSSDRRKVRALSYRQEGEAWVASDITFVAEHITEGLIKEAHFARDPSSTIVLVLDSGEVVCCTFDRAEQVTAWWRVKTTGTVLSGAVSDGPEGSQFFLAAARATGSFLEVLPFSEFAAGRVYCDSAVTVPALEGVTTVGGFSHLEGALVDVVIGGAHRGQKTVAAGQITLDEETAPILPTTTATLGFYDAAWDNEVANPSDGQFVSEWQLAQAVLVAAGIVNLSTASAPAKSRMVIYADTAGVLSLVAVSDEKVGLTAGDNVYTFGGVVLTPGTYWIGIHSDTALTIRGKSGANVNFKSAADTYSDGTTAPAGWTGSGSTLFRTIIQVSGSLIGTVYVTAGLPYTSTAKTLKPVTQRGAQRSVSRWARLLLRLYRSAFPKVDGERIRPDRSPSTALDTAEPLFTGDAGPSDTDAENGGQVTIVQDLPLRTEVLALHGVLSESEV
jgi:hypothetical protein